MLFCKIVIAQNRFTDTTTTLVAYWKKGDIKQFEIIDEKISYKNDTLTESEIDIDTINFIVAGETSKSYLIEWEYLGHSSTDTTDKLTQKITEKINKKFGNLRLEYSTSETGAFQQIENWEKLSKAFSYAFDEFIKSEKKNEELVSLLKKLKTIYQTKEGIENVFNKYLNTFHYLYGLEYFKNNPYYLETTLPNVLGGDPFPATLAIKLDSINTIDQLAYISINQSIDKEKAKENIIQLMEKIGGKVIEDKGFLDELFIIKDKMNYCIDIPEGWIRKYEFIRTLKIDTVKKFTKISINLLP